MRPINKQPPFQMNEKYAYPTGLGEKQINNRPDSSRGANNYCAAGKTGALLYTTRIKRDLPSLINAEI
jgi:hypothetical protein